MKLFKFYLVFVLLFFSGCGSYNINLNESIPVTANISNPYQLTVDEYNLQNGNSYSGSETFSLNSGESYYISVVTDNISICMCERQIIGYSTEVLNVVANIYEGGDYLSGSLMTNYNNNRNKIDNSTIRFYNGVTLVSLGDKLPHSSFLYGDKKIAAETNSEISYVMKKDSNYILKIENLGSKSADLTFIWNWFENPCNS
jgi:hypothetical protein